MKVGDKLLCKNTYNSFVNISKYFTINKYYDIILIVDDKSIRIIDDSSGLFLFVSDNNDVWYIWDIFYTKEEMRKKKINSI